MSSLFEPLATFLPGSCRDHLVMISIPSDVPSGGQRTRVMVRAPVAVLAISEAAGVKANVIIANAFHSAKLLLKLKEHLETKTVVEIGDALGWEIIVKPKP